MISEASVNLQRLASTARALRNQQNLTVHFESRLEALKKIHKDLVGWRDSWSAMAQGGIVGLHELPNLTGTQQYLQGLIHRAKSEPQTLLNTEFSVTLKKLEDEVQALQGLLRPRWRQYCNETPVALPEVMVNVLHKDPQTARKLNALRVKSDALLALRAKMSITPEMVREAIQLKREIDALNNELSRLDIPDEVMAFLEAAQKGGALIGALTPEILQWLQEHQFTHIFKIVLK